MITIPRAISVDPARQLRHLPRDDADLLISARRRIPPELRSDCQLPYFVGALRTKPCGMGRHGLRASSSKITSSRLPRRRCLPLCGRLTPGAVRSAPCWRQEPQTAACLTDTAASAIHRQAKSTYTSAMCQPAKGVFSSARQVNAASEPKICTRQEIAPRMAVAFGWYSRHFRQTSAAV